MIVTKPMILTLTIIWVFSCSKDDNNVKEQPNAPIETIQPVEPVAPLEPKILARINSGGGQVTSGAITFDADKYFLNGSGYTNNSIADITNTDLDAIYVSERNNNGDFGYAIPVTENGNYIVKLHFAEIYFGASGGGAINGENNNRQFSVSIEGTQVLTNYNISQEVGPMAAVIKTFEIAVSDKIIHIDFSQGVVQPKLSGFEILGYGNAEIVLGPCDWRENLADAHHNHIEGQVATVNGKLYLFGGFEPANAPLFEGDTSSPLIFVNETEIYDPSTDTWSAGAPMPTPLSHGGMQAVGDKIWIIGGFLGDNGGLGTDLVQIYDTTTNTWAAGPSIPNKRASVAAVLVDNRLHIFGGYSEDREGNIDEHYFYDLNNKGAGWQQLAKLPIARGHHGGAAIDGIIYAIGGQLGHNTTNMGNINNVEAYNFATDSWTNVASLPFPRSHFELSTLTHNGKIMIAGGNNGANDILLYDAIANQWTVYCELPNAILMPTMMVSGGKLIITCGGNGNNWNPTKKTRWIPI